MENKIKKLLKTLLIEIKDINLFKKDFNSILEMFNEISNFNINLQAEKTLQKKVHYTQLRDDIPNNQKQIKKYRGIYFSVPKVVKKK